MVFQISLLFDAIMLTVMSDMLTFKYKFSYFLFKQIKKNKACLSIKKNYQKPAH